jgi:antitoxin VapB
MALKIEDERAERLARELARRTGESIEEAVSNALEERLTRLEQQPAKKPDPQAIEALLAHFRALPDLDARSPEEILGYDERGLF